jgi:hypothetical protein
MMKGRNDMEPHFIEAVYSVGITFNIEEVEKDLGISWSNVADFYVKWGNLFVVMKDGRDFEISGDELCSEAMLDFKRPDKVLVLDGNYKAIKE